MAMTKKVEGVREGIETAKDREMRAPWNAAVKEANAADAELKAAEEAFPAQIGAGFLREDSPEVIAAKAKVKAADRLERESGYSYYLWKETEIDRTLTEDFYDQYRKRMEQLFDEARLKRARSRELIEELEQVQPVAEVKTTCRRSVRRGGTRSCKRQ
jgi:hypothetical protein